MAPKKPLDRVEARNVLNAVLLADSFTQRFRPITVERPKCLLPLVNVPMIEYTLEWLAMNKVEETFVFCCAHADQIKKYLNESKWGSTASSGRQQMRVTTIVSTNCTSAGEALRIIDQRDVIKSDFVLVSGDTVSNVNLAPILEAHRSRRSADKNAIMTMVMKAVNHPNQRIRLGVSETLLCMDPASSRLLKYQEIEGGGKAGSMIKVDAAFFSERDNIQVRTDLMDTQISICAPEVLMLFSDNFDYQNVKKDFVSGVLSEEELGNKLFVHELSNEYAAHIPNLRSFDAVSRDVLQRWAYPFVPDTNVLQPRTGHWGIPAYSYARGHVYCEKIQVPRSSVLGSDICIGAGTIIGEGCQIRQSVIGRSCRIGKNVQISGSYLHDNVTVQDNACLHNALVCEDAVVLAGAIVDPGAIVSFGVVIGPGHRVLANKRLSLFKQAQGPANLSDDELEYSSSVTKSAVGSMEAADSARRLHSGFANDDEDEDGFDDTDVAKSFEKPSSWAVNAAKLAALGKILEESGSHEAAQFNVEDVGAGGAGYDWQPNEGFDIQRYSIAVPSDMNKLVIGDSEVDFTEAGSAGDGSEEDQDSDRDNKEDEEELDPETTFKVEVGETFLRCVKMRFEKTNAIIELNSLKIAEDRSFADCARYIFTTMLSMCLPVAPYYAKGEYASLFPTEAPDTTTQDGKLALLKAFKQHLTKWSSLLRQFLRSEDDQVELLLTFEEFCSEEGVFEGQGERGAAFAEIFVQILQQLYEGDVLSEEALLSWAEEKEHADASDKVYLTKAAKFIEWLQTADDDDDDDESSEEEDS